MPCRRCGEAHDIFACPNVKAIELDDKQNVVRVEFLTPLDFPREQQSEPEQTYDRLKPSKGA